MSITERVLEICKDKMQEVAETIEGEMKAEASKHRGSYRSPTGMAAASIHIEPEGEFQIFVGAHASFPRDGNDGGTHLYYMTQGNSGNGAGGRIYPTRAKMLKLKDGSVRRSVSPYSGRNFIHDIAMKHS